MNRGLKLFHYLLRNSLYIYFSEAKHKHLGAKFLGHFPTPTLPKFRHHLCVFHLRKMKNAKKDLIKIRCEGWMCVNVAY